MPIENALRFDTTKQRPQVLMFGNGMLRCLPREFPSWSGILEEIAEEFPRGTECISDFTKKGLQVIPLPILSDIAFSRDDAERHNAYEKAFKRWKSNADSDLVKELLSSNFDAILTTNYTYDLECVFQAQLKVSKQVERKYTSKRSDAKYLIHTYNQVGNSPQIWHIHGDMERKSSLIFTHDEYGRLINQMLKYNEEMKNYYQRFANNLYFRSWLDYFIMGDVYAVGCGFNFAEADLWWLLNRRMREKASIGKLYFYEPQGFEAQSQQKIKALNYMGITCESFGIAISKEEQNERYVEFYKKAIRDICLKVQEKKTF